MNKIESYIIYVISMLLVVTSIYLLVQDTNWNMYTYIPVMFIMLSILYTELLLVPHKKTKNKLIIVSSFNFLVITLIGFFSIDNAYCGFYFIVIFQLLRYFGMRVGFLSTAISYGVTSFVAFIRVPGLRTFLMESFELIGLYSGFIIFASLVWYIIEQNKQLIKTKKALLEENLHNAYNYEQLKRAYDDLEDYTIMKERTALSREMHDTVGHTLTAALVELEVCKLLMDKEVKENEVKEDQVDREKREVIEHIEHISEEVRRGLQTLRTTVRRIKNDSNWIEEIYRIGEQLSKYTPIQVIYLVDHLEGIPVALLRCIYRLLQEGITNGIKHGKATVFVLKVERSKEQMHIELTDNGQGATGFKKGFGLIAMTERVEALGGRILFDSYKDEGFTIKVDLPIQEGSEPK